jgi:uridine phosphorylase
MVMIPSELTYLARRAGARSVRFSDLELYRMYQARPGKGPPLTLCGPFLGAPHAVLGMEKLIALGVERIWVMGWCGSIHPEVRVGHVVLPTDAHCEEGTSPHYPISDGPPAPDKHLNRRLVEALEREALPCIQGTVWTTDALYRETPEKVERYQRRGILAVEMEMSALMTVAHYRGVSLAALLVVSDELFALRWRPGFSDPDFKRNSRAAGRALLQTAKSASDMPGGSK